VLLPAALAGHPATHGGERILVWSLADGRLFVLTTEDLILRLNFDSGVGPARLSSALVPVRSILADARAYAHRAGEDGVRFCQLAGRLVDDLEVVVRDHDAGDRSAWTARRGELLDVWSELEQLVDQAAPASTPASDGLVAAVFAPAAAVSGGEKAKKRAGVQKRRGRTKSPVEEGAPFRAAFWMYEATGLIPDDQHELRSAIEILGPDARPQQVFDLLHRHGLTVMLSAVRNRVPACWPKAPNGIPVPSWEFCDYAVDLNADSFARNLRRHAKDLETSPDLTRHTRQACAELKLSNVYTPTSHHGPTRKEIFQRSIISAAMAVEEALGRVNAIAKEGRHDPDAWEKLRQTMIDRLRVPPEDVDELLAGRSLETADRVAAFVVKARRRAGDDGDCDPDGRLK